MTKSNVALLAFNRGEISPEVLTRVDVDRVRLSAETMVNWIPKTQGSMQLRCGTGYLGSSKTNQEAFWIPFVAATDDTALLELTPNVMRVWIDDELVTIPGVTTTISNGSFATSTDWTDSSTNASGGTPAGFSGSGLTLNAINRGGLAKVTREITVAAPDINARHTIVLTIGRGPVTFRCGSTSGGDEFITAMSAGTGTHYLSFTPTGNFHLTFESDLLIDRIVTSIAIAAAGNLEVTTPWGSPDLDYLRYDQSADVLYVACKDVQQRKIEHRGDDSWSVVLYQPNSGPFDAVRSAKVKLKIGANEGNTTLTSDKPFFKSTHVGALFRIFTEGYNIQHRLGAEDSYTDIIRVSGVGNDRKWAWSIAGTWVGTVRSYKSTISEDTGFGRDSADGGTSGSSSTVTKTINGSGSHSDSTAEDNLISWWKLGFETGAYTSGVALVTLDYAHGGGWGIARVTGFNSNTSVNVEILDTFTRAAYWSDNWQEGIWSDKRGWPTSVSLHEGARLWWFGATRVIGSVSDDYENFDPAFEGDAGPIIRSIGSGPVDNIHFALSLSHLIIGSASQINSIRSSSFDEPITPSNMTSRNSSSRGTAVLPAVKVDTNGIYVQRSGKSLIELGHDQSAQEYVDRDLTILHPKLAPDGIIDLAVQRHPDTRIYAVLGDGTLAVLTYNPAENLQAWSRIDVGGTVERVVVLPGPEEDFVYLHVMRTINGNGARYLEKFSLESECVGGSINKMADSFVIYAGTATTTITGLSHLEGEEVIVWAAGVDFSSDDDNGVQTTYTVAGGQITGLPSAVSSAVIGLPYEARYKSTKLAYAAQAGTALAQPKRVDHVGLILGTTHNNGLFYGPDFDTMDPIPRIIEGVELGDNEIFEEFDGPSFEFPGSWDTDSRLCLKAKAPRPASVLAAIASINTSEKI